jgi:putative SOS response-associated peptidase YedK
MCNLYNLTTSQEAIRQWTRALRDILGNLEPSIDIYPNQFGPVVRNAQDGSRELANLRWGMPTLWNGWRATPIPAPPTSAIRQYGHWQQYVGIEHRCVVPVTSFAEPSPTPNDKDPETGGIQRNFWFALNEERPLFFFAGLWNRWHGVRKVKEGPGDHEVYGFMTAKPNALIAPLHEKAMPVI